MSLAVTLLVVCAPVLILLAVSRNQKEVRRVRSATVDLHADELGVRRTLADGREEGIDWAEVTEVEVLATTAGPHAASGGVVIISGDAERGCLVPIDQLQTSGVLEGLSRLPGFDMAQFTATLAAGPATAAPTRRPIVGGFAFLQPSARPTPGRVTCWTRPD